MDIRLAAYFLVMLNPFSQILFLEDLMTSMTWRQFNAVYGRACLLSYGVFALFALTGEFLFLDIFQVRLDAFRIFGGVIIFTIALRYFTHGGGSNQFFQGSAMELASSISLPVMVGPGTIWVSILIGRNHSVSMALLLLGIILAINFVAISIAQRFVSHLRTLKDNIAGAYLFILMRTNALFIGAIGIEMILTGIEGMAGDDSR